MPYDAVMRMGHKSVKNLLRILEVDAESEAARRCLYKPPKPEG